MRNRRPQQRRQWSHTASKYTPAILIGRKLGWTRDLMLLCERGRDTLCVSYYLACVDRLPAPPTRQSRTDQVATAAPSRGREHCGIPLLPERRRPRRVGRRRNGGSLFYACPVDTQEHQIW